jgi:hypothetical protein
VETLVSLSQAKEFDSMPLGMPNLALSLLAIGPTSTATIHYLDGGSALAGWRERQEQIDELTAHIHSYVARAPFNPGANLVPPPSFPQIMPYKPYDP